MFLKYAKHILRAFVIVALFWNISRIFSFNSFCSLFYLFVKDCFHQCYFKYHPRCLDLILILLLSLYLSICRSMYVCMYLSFYINIGHSLDFISCNMKAGALSVFIFFIVAFPYTRRVAHNRCSANICFLFFLNCKFKFKFWKIRQGFF